MDLSLLVAFDALLEEGSVSAAADRLRVTQPAMSRTLARIRHATGDEIVVRDGRRMLPTPYALSVAAEIHDIVARARTVLSPSAELDLGSLERTFTLQCNDALADVLVARLTATVVTKAPGVRLRVSPESERSNDDLRRGRIDLRISADPADAPELTSEVVIEDRLVVAARRTHPELATLDTLDGFAAVRHVVVSRRGHHPDRIDEALALQGRRRDVVLIAPSLSVAVATVASSDLVVVVPAALASLQLQAHGLATRPLPIATPALAAMSTWHQRNDNDRAHEWVRRQVRRVMSSTATPKI